MTDPELRVGDLAKIVGNDTAMTHYLKLGSIVRVIRVPDPVTAGTYDVEALASDFIDDREEGYTQHIVPDDLEKIEQDVFSLQEISDLFVTAWREIRQSRRDRRKAETILSKLHGHVDNTTLMALNRGQRDLYADMVDAALTRGAAMVGETPELVDRWWDE